MPQSVVYGGGVVDDSYLFFALRPGESQHQSAVFQADGEEIIAGDGVQQEARVRRQFEADIHHQRIR